MTGENIGYKPTELAKMPKVREKTVEVKMTALKPDDQFISKLLDDLTPEEIEILDFANHY